MPNEGDEEHAAAKTFKAMQLVVTLENPGTLDDSRSTEIQKVNFIGRKLITIKLQINRQ